MAKGADDDDEDVRTIAFAGRASEGALRVAEGFVAAFDLHTLTVFWDVEAGAYYPLANYGPSG